MTQMLHNNLKSLRPADSTRLGVAASVICGSYFKGNEWYDATRTRREVGLKRKR